MPYPLVARNTPASPTITCRPGTYRQQRERVRMCTPSAIELVLTRRPKRWAKSTFPHCRLQQHGHKTIRCFIQHHDAHSRLNATTLICGPEAHSKSCSSTQRPAASSRQPAGITTPRPLHVATFMSQTRLLGVHQPCHHLSTLAAWMLNRYTDTPRGATTRSILGMSSSKAAIVSCTSSAGVATLLSGLPETKSSASWSPSRSRFRMGDASNCKYSRPFQPRRITRGLRIYRNS